MSSVSLDSRQIVGLGVACGLGGDFLCPKGGTGWEYYLRSGQACVPCGS